MPIPPIDDYIVPSPPARTQFTWSIEAHRAVLLVHDMQEYFVAPFARDGDLRRELLDRLSRLVVAARSQGTPIVYTAQPGAMSPVDRGLLHDRWGAGMSDSNEDTAIVSELAPHPDDVTLTKWRYSAFVRTNLEEIIRSSGRDQLIITGVYASFGCLSTALDAYALDIQPFLVTDAVADFDRASHEMAINYVSQACAMALPCSRAIAHITKGTVHD